MVSLKHKFQSQKADGSDSTEVRPSNWNDEHDFILEGPGVVGRQDPGSGPAALIPFSGIGLIPTGAMIPFAGAVEPAGFLFPFGQVLNRADQPNLFAVIGTQYNTGGETASQFRLPDMRDVVPAGRGNMGGTARGLLDNSTGLGGLMGSKDVTLTASQQADMPLEGTLNASITPGSIVNTSAQGANFGNSVTSGGNRTLYETQGEVTGTVSGSAKGGGQPHPNVQPTTIVNWLIKT